jgi:mannose-6-phosphate isomerase-like protein (cupin superfamily)
MAYGGIKTVKTVDHKTIEATPVSHNPEIAKRVILANGIVDNITQMSQAILKPGQATTAHIHTDMTEIYTIYSGMAEFTVAGISHLLNGPATTVIFAGEEHSVANNSEAPITLHYLGVLSSGRSNA